MSETKFYMSAGTRLSFAWSTTKYHQNIFHKPFTRVKILFLCVEGNSSNHFCPLGSHCWFVHAKEMDKLQRLYDTIVQEGRTQSQVRYAFYSKVRLSFCVRWYTCDCRLPSTSVTRLPQSEASGAADRKLDLAAWVVRLPAFQRPWTVKPSPCEIWCARDYEVRSG